MEIKRLSSDHELRFDANQLVKSPIFNRKAVGYITGFNIHDLEGPRSPLEQMESDLNHSPDGALFWMPKGHKDAFFEFAVAYMCNAYKQDRLNFENGLVCETLIFQDFNEGTLVELIDPECGTFLFEEMVNAFMEKYQHTFTNEKTLTQFIYYEDCHLDSNWKRECPSADLVQLLQPYSQV